MKIADYRNKVEHLERVFHVDRHACVGNKEKAYWFERAGRILAEVAPMECPRAKPDDIERKNLIVNKVTTYLEENEQPQTVKQ